MAKPPSFFLSPNPFVRIPLPLSWSEKTFVADLCKVPYSELTIWKKLVFRARGMPDEWGYVAWIWAFGNSIPQRRWDCILIMVFQPEATRLGPLVISSRQAISHRWTVAICTVNTQFASITMVKIQQTTLFLNYFENLDLQLLPSSTPIKC